MELHDATTEADDNQSACYGDSDATSGPTPSSILEKGIDTPDHPEVGQAQGERRRTRCKRRGRNGLRRQHSIADVNSREFVGPTFRRKYDLAGERAQKRKYSGSYRSDKHESMMSMREVS